MDNTTEIEQRVTFRRCQHCEAEIIPDPSGDTRWIDQRGMNWCRDTSRRHAPIADDTTSPVAAEGGETDDRTRVVNGELRHYGTTTCDDCGTGLILPGWLCYDCAGARGLR